MLSSELKLKLQFPIETSFTISLSLLTSVDKLLAIMYASIKFLSTTHSATNISLNVIIKLSKLSLKIFHSFSVIQSPSGSIITSCSLSICDDNFLLNWFMILFSYLIIKLLSISLNIFHLFIRKIVRPISSRYFSSISSDISSLDIISSLVNNGLINKKFSNIDKLNWEPSCSNALTGFHSDPLKYINTSLYNHNCPNTGLLGGKIFVIWSTIWNFFWKIIFHVFVALL